MAKKKSVREPQQSRSIQMKERILKTALQLFCRKGFYQTTTNEIAQAAGVSVASLYAYFKDRDSIFFEILEQYHQQFVALHEAAISRLNTQPLGMKEWLSSLVDDLISLHERSREFNRELKVLYYSNPKVAAIMDRQNKETQQMIMGYLQSQNPALDAKDLEVTASLCFDFIAAVVDRIVFLGKPGERSERKRVQQVGVAALFKLLEL